MHPTLPALVQELCFTLASSYEVDRLLPATAPWMHVPAPPPAPGQQHSKQHELCKEAVRKQRHVCCKQAKAARTAQVDAPVTAAGAMACVCAWLAALAPPRLPRVRSA